MKASKLFSAGVAAWVLSFVSSYGQLSLNFSSTPGATIQFNGSGSSFQFNTSAYAGLGGIYLGTLWDVTSETGGNSSIGLFGTFSSGPFAYGPITVSGSTETANVIGPSAAMSIDDGLGNSLTGNVNWIQVETDNSIGGLNGSLMVNVSGLAYSGSNPDLLALVSDGAGALNVSFQFSPAESLTQLTSGTGPYTTSFSGSLSVPEPATLASLLMGLGLLGGWRQLAKIRRS